MVEANSKKISELKEKPENISHPEFNQESLDCLSQYWYCDSDSSKYVEKFDGYSRNNTGQFTIYLDDRLDHSIENAISIRKLPESCETFTRLMIDEIKNCPLPENSNLKYRTEVHLLQVECPICKKITIAPKIPVSGLENVRKSQVDTIKYSIKGIEEKYDAIRKRLDFMFFVGAGIILILGLIFILLWLIFMLG